MNQYDDINGDIAKLGNRIERVRQNLAVTTRKANAEINNLRQQQVELNLKKRRILEDNLRKVAK